MLRVLLKLCVCVLFWAGEDRQKTRSVFSTIFFLRCATTEAREYNALAALCAGVFSQRVCSFFSLWVCAVAETIGKRATKALTSQKKKTLLFPHYFQRASLFVSPRSPETTTMHGTFEMVSNERVRACGVSEAGTRARATTAASWQQCCHGSPHRPPSPARPTFPPSRAAWTPLRGWGGRRGAQTGRGGRRRGGRVLSLVPPRAALVGRDPPAGRPRRPPTPPARACVSLGSRARARGRRRVRRAVHSVCGHALRGLRQTKNRCAREPVATFARVTFFRGW